MAKVKELPTYLFTGFLEAGKTKFIQGTLEDKNFCGGEKTLLIVCEEGEEEYSPEQFVDKSVYIRTVTDEKELTKEKLAAWQKETGAERAMVEYNGMWMLDSIYNALPEGWMVYQELMFVDARSFLNYNANMRQLCFDKMQSCEAVIFNRFDASMDKMELHKIVRGASRRANIAYEYEGGKVEYDDIQDPLPFDVNAPIIEIDDMDYALWYRDMSEESEKYEGKTVRFKGRALSRKKMPKGSFIIGRHVMTCCEADIQFAALVCQWADADKVKDDSWIELTAKINFKFNSAYARKGPVLTFISAKSCEIPAQPVATFY